ncbi:MAG: HDIG domain-containing protein [Acidimicrobiia bacterium]|nr:HDIG domain-containing protein [Acidimicrobiia bacterium]
MSRRLIRARFVRAVIVVLAITLTWGVLLIGQQRSDITLTIGQASPLAFVADGPVVVTDEAETELARQQAEDAVDPVFNPDPVRTREVLDQIAIVIETAKEGVYLEEVTTTTTTATTSPELEPTTTSSTQPATTTTVGEGEPASTTTTEPVAETAGVRGFLFLDANADGLFQAEAGDAPLVSAAVRAVDSDGREFQTQTDATGTFAILGMAAGDVAVTVAASDPRLEHFSASTDNLQQEATAEAASVSEIDAVGFAPLTRTLETQQQALRDALPTLQPVTIETLTTLATADVMRSAQGLTPYLSDVQEKAIARAADVLAGGIQTSEELSTARTALDFNWPPVILNDEYNPEASAAAADVVKTTLLINETFDAAATAAAQAQARQEVQPESVSFRPGDTIVGEGETVTAVHKAAIIQLGLLKQTGLQVLAMLAVVAMLVGMLSFYLARFREQFWANTKRVVLFGALIVLAAGAARWIAILTPDDNLTVGYLIPAATFGFMAAILFDARIGVIMSMAVGALTAIATRDPGLSLFALLSAMSPIPFVSSISARGDLRKAIVYTALALTPLAAAISWFFAGLESVPLAALYGFLNGFLSGLVGVTAVSFFEIIFDITTTLRLLDLTDRNHPALQMLEEKARGTFNHSLLVGTLGDRAAKSIGANNLLVRASAYYHDLGKTENPQFFIENQFGISNPHDHMPPEESAQAIRQHVIDGVSLAKKYRIPALVADSVVAHHGDGIMRYFYHKAIERYGEENVNVDDFRHHGHKPRTKENAILMMADALEGASRAVFADDDPSPEKIRRVVEQVVGEKVGDGQLSESALTLGELTKVKEAFVDALIGHYHQRIPYPDFPEAPPSPGGSRAETTESSRTVVVSADAEEEPSPTDVTNVEFRP